MSQRHFEMRKSCYFYMGSVDIVFQIFSFLALLENQTFYVSIQAQGTMKKNQLILLCVLVQLQCSVEFDIWAWYRRHFVVCYLCNAVY